VRHEKKEWHPGFEVSPARKRETAMQGRSVQQSKFLITLVLHRRATWNEAHNAHVMQQMAGACTALMSDAGREHLRRLLRFGFIWSGVEKGWQTWTPKKAGAVTTGVGHYVSTAPTRTHADYLEALEMDDDREADIKLFWNEQQDAPYMLDDLKEGNEPHPYAKAVPGDIFLPDEYATDLFDDVVKSINSQVGIEVGPVARLFHFHMLRWSLALLYGEQTDICLSGTRFETLFCRTSPYYMGELFKARLSEAVLIPWLLMEIV